MSDKEIQLPAIKKVLKPIFRYGFEFEGIVLSKYWAEFKNGLREINPNINIGYDASIVGVPFGYHNIEFSTPKLSEKCAFVQFEDILCYLWILSQESIFITNSSCGLHINMSEANIFSSGKQLQYYSNIVANFDEDAILKLFGRENSTYCRAFKKSNRCRSVGAIYKKISYLDKIQDRIDYYQRNRLNKKYYCVALRENPTDSFEKNHRIEFRAIGNKDYHLRLKDLTKAVSHVITVSKNSLSVPASLCV